MSNINIEFLLECLTGYPNPKIVLRDYETIDGYRVKNCPYRMLREELCSDGRDSVIPVGVQYRIFEILLEMRKDGVKEKNYSSKERE